MVTANPDEEAINMHTLSTPLSKQEKHAHDEIAALLSIVPGLGHIYKGHYEVGFLWMFLGMPTAIWIDILFGRRRQRLVCSSRSCAGWHWRLTPTTKKTGVAII